MAQAEPARDYAPDAFSAVLGNKRGRIRRKPRRRQPGESRALSTIAADAQRQPKEPEVVRALVSELRQHWGSGIGGPEANEPLGRLAAASLLAGADAAWRGRPSARSKVGKAEAVKRRLALAEARVLFAGLAGDRAGDWKAVLSSKGRAKGTLRGAALERQRRLLAEDIELLQADSANRAAGAAVSAAPAKLGP